MVRPLRIKISEKRPDASWMETCVTAIRRRRLYLGLHSSMVSNVIKAGMGDSRFKT
jgi:hypothetical protein